MNLMSFVPAPWKLAAAGIAVVGLAGALGAAALAIDRHGYERAAAAYEPKLEAAAAALATVNAANAANLAALRRLTAQQAADDALIAGYEARIADLNQQARDTTAAIRKLETDDQTVAAYLRTPVPAALRGVLDDAGAAAGNADGRGAAAAAGGAGRALPNARAR